MLSDFGSFFDADKKKIAWKQYLFHKEKKK